MEHRNLPGQPQMPEYGRTWNHQPSGPRINPGTAAFTLHAENLGARSLNSVQSSNADWRMGSRSVPNYHPDVSNHMPNSIASPYGPFVHPVAGISPQFPSEYVQHGPYFNQIGVNYGCATSNSEMDYDRATRKRKFQATLDFGRGNSSANYYVGSSSNFPSSSEHTQKKPMIGPQYSCWDHGHFVPSHRSNNLLHSEGPQGSVGRCYGVHHGTSPALCLSSNMSHNFHSAANTSGSTVAGQWSQNRVPLIAHANLTSSGSGTFNHEMGHPHGMGCVSSGNVGVAETYNFTSSPHRNVMPSPYLTGPSTRDVITGRGEFNQRTNNTTNVNHPPNGLAVSPENTRMIVPPWCLRPVEVVGHYNERNGRVRNHSDRLSALTDEHNARARWVSEGASVYGDSRILYDQHHEMRLDIDNMSYEELLALGESIGCVSTGLSEDTVSKCLTETTYRSSDHIPDEAERNCAICLEAYEEQEQVGRLNCRHDFHASCITKWLLIKNVCPICKASALTEQ